MPLPQDVNDLLQKLQGPRRLLENQWGLDLGIDGGREAYPRKEKRDSFLEIEKKMMFCVRGTGPVKG